MKIDPSKAIDIIYGKLIVALMASDLALLDEVERQLAQRFGDKTISGKQDHSWENVSPAQRIDQPLP